MVARLAPTLATGKGPLRGICERLVLTPTEGNAWHADHIRAVYQGGGLCDLENLRTLCVACHHHVTMQQVGAQCRSWAHMQQVGLEESGELLAAGAACSESCW